MEIVTKTRHTKKLPGQLKEYAEEKIQAKCAKYLDAANSAIRCEIEFDDMYGPKQGLDKRVDITISLPRHAPIHVEECDADFKEAVDKANDRLDQPLEKYKELIAS